MEKEGIVINPLFVFRETESRRECVTGKLIKVGELRNVAKMQAAGIAIKEAEEKPAQNTI